MTVGVHHNPLRGFTLVEMLVVVAIILVLVAIALPSIDMAIDITETAQCQANNRQFLIAYSTYTIDNRNGLVRGEPPEHHEPNAYPDPDDNNFKPTECFVKRGSGYSAIKQGALFPYLRDLDAWQCPADPGGNERSYVIVGVLRGEGWDKPYRNGTQRNESYPAGTNRLTRIRNPGRQIVFMEESDNRGWNIGSWLIEVWEGSWKWTDYVGLFHARQTADDIGFLDGHVERWVWKDPETLAAGRSSKFYLNDSGNQDYTDVRRCYRQLPADAAPWGTKIPYIP